jgi:Acetyltransferase (GNAT) family
MNQDELLYLSDVNLAESYREFSRWSKNADIAEQGDVLFVCGASTFPALNFAIRTNRQPQTPPDLLISRAREFFAERKRSFTITVRKHIDQDLLGKCEELKLYKIVEIPGMFIEKTLEEKPLPDGVTLKHVINKSMVNDFAEVVALSFVSLGMPEEACRSSFSNPNAFLVPHIYAVVAYKDEKPVSCALALLSHGIGGIYYVGTIESARGIGLAEHCVRAAGNAAFKFGARFVILQASIYGEPIYKRMGYQESTRYIRYLCRTR